MKRWNHNGADLLRRGRISRPGATYFVTVCTGSRRNGLTERPVAERVFDVLDQSERDGDFRLLCATLMPDHLHLLFVLGHRLSLSKVIAKAKRGTKEIVESHSIDWQENFFDHRLRAASSTEDFAFYLFLNPYRKNLIPIQESWPWWRVSNDYRPKFSDLLNPQGGPQPEWIPRGLDARSLIDSELSATEGHSGRAGLC